MAIIIADLTVNGDTITITTKGKILKIVKEIKEAIKLLRED